MPQYELLNVGDKVLITQGDDFDKGVIVEIALSPNAPEVRSHIVEIERSKVVNYAFGMNRPIIDRYRMTKIS
jgi:hypothetical protein